MIIAFEGMDGVGKTSVAESFSLKNNFLHEEQKITRLLDVDNITFKKFVKRIRKSNNKKLSAVFYTFRCMLDNDEPEKDSVVERTVASLYYFEKNNVDEGYWDQIIKLGVLPDLIFLLYATPETRLRRIYKRNMNDADLNSSEALADGYDDFIEFYKKYNIPYIGINTENLSFEETTNICTSIYEQYKKLNSDEDKYEFISKMNNFYGVDALYKQKVLVKRINNK